MSKSRTIKERFWAILTVVGVISGTPACHQDAEVVGTVPVDSFDRFRSAVVPVLESRCSGCHGVSEEEYETLSAEPQNRLLLRWITDGGLRISTEQHARLAFLRFTEPVYVGEKSFVPIDFATSPLASAVVRSPLGERLGGVPHPVIFSSADDPDLVALTAWVAAEISHHPELSTHLKSEAELIFANEVVPVLARKGCFGSNCHGKHAFNDLKLDGGVPLLPERFTSGIQEKNRRTMLGETTRLTHLSGDVEQSRQIKKSILVDQGGIVHKGGNQFLKKGDPDYQVFVKWLQAEKREAERRVGAQLGVVDGWVFLRRPRSSPERYFEPIRFLPGGDLFWRRGTQEINLTAGLHPDGPADIRAADVSYDGKRVIFAMRRDASEPFNVWELDLLTQEPRQLTFSVDPEVFFIDPIYAPSVADLDGSDLSRADVVMLSNLSKQTAPVSPDVLLGEAERGGLDTIEDFQRTEKVGKFVGRTVRVLRGTNASESRTIVHSEPGKLTVTPPFSRPIDSTTHYIIDAEQRFAPKMDLYRLPLAGLGTEKELFRSELHRMTYSPDQARAPSVRSSGEVMATFLRTGWQAGRPFFNGAIFRTHADGSNFHTHSGNRSAVAIFANNREMPDGREVRIGRDADSWWGGSLIVSDHQFGPSIEPDNPLDNLDHPYLNGPLKTALPRFFPTFVSVDPDVLDHGISPGGVYQDAYPLPDGSLLVSYASGPVDLDDLEAAPDFDLVRLVPDPEFRGEFGPGSFRREVVLASPLAELWPRPVVVRLKERPGPMLKTERDILGPPSVIGAGTRYPQTTPALLQIYDLPLLAAFFEQTTPIGERHIAHGTCGACGKTSADVDQIQFLRVVGQLVDHDTNELKKAVLAELPIMADGSVQAVIPSGVPFDIEAVNGMGMTVSSPHRWLYAHPGEKHTLSIPRSLYTQTCAGCHGSLSGVSEQSVGLVDAVTGASRTLAIWDAKNHRRRTVPNFESGSPNPAEFIGFEKDIRPLLEKHCVSCHSDVEPKAGLSLTGPTAYEKLLKLVDKDDRRATRSHLIERLVGRELYAPAVLPTAGPHPSPKALSQREISTFIRWIDLGAYGL
ncbi:MAG: hypothetical protein HUU55_16830 [Myxococcales bacterium]|nr:hypothetical protein [Myxococcales bacterium]